MSRLLLFVLVLSCSQAFAFSTHLPSADTRKMGGDLPFPLGNSSDPTRPEPHIDGIKVPQVKESWQLRWIDDQRAEALIWKEGRWLDRATLELQGQRLVGSSRRMESFEIDLNARYLHACFKNQNGPCAVLSIKTKEM